jgi:hypothetical protein
MRCTGLPTFEKSAAMAGCSFKVGNSLQKSPQKKYFFSFVYTNEIALSLLCK